MRGVLLWLRVRFFGKDVSVAWLWATDGSCSRSLAIGCLTVFFFVGFVIFSPFGGLLYRLQSGVILRLSVVFSGGEVERLDM